MRRLQTITGFVVEDCGDGVYYAWSSSVRNDLLIYSQPRQNILARWVELTIDETGEVCEPAVVTGDRYEYRLDGRYAELLLSVRHDGCFRNRMEMFKHHDLGAISDPDHVVRNIQQNANYMVWVIPNRFESETKARWVVSTRNGDPQPNSQRSGTQSPTYSYSQRDNRRPNSPDNYNNTRQRSRSSDRSQRVDSRYEDYNRRSPDFRSRDNYGYRTGPPTYDNRRPRSPSPKNYYQDDKSSVRSGMSGRDSFDSYRTRSPVNQQPAYGNMGHSSQSRYPEHRRPSTPEFDNRNRDLPSVNNRRQSPPPAQRPLQRVSTAEQDVQRTNPADYIQTQYQPKRDCSPSERSRSRAETTSEEESDDEDQSKKSNFTSEKNVQNNEPTLAEAQSDNIAPQVIIPSNTSKPSDLDKVQPVVANRLRSALKPPQTPEEKEAHLLRLKMNQMKELVRKLTRHEEVALAMRLASFEEFEELIGLVQQK